MYGSDSYLKHIAHITVLLEHVIMYLMYIQSIKNGTTPRQAKYLNKHVKRAIILLLSIICTECISIVGGNIFFIMQNVTISRKMAHFSYHDRAIIFQHHVLLEMLTYMSRLMLCRILRKLFFIFVHLPGVTTCIFLQLKYYCL